MSEHTVEGPAVKKLERSSSDRMLAGVSGGLARYFEIHPAFFRVGFVVLTLLGGAGILIYLAAALVMPDEGKEDSVVTAALKTRRDRPWPLIGLGLLAVAGAILLSHATLWPDADAWVVLLIAGGAILWITRRSKAEGSTAEELAASDSRRLRRFVKGIAIAFGALIAVVLVAAAVFVSVVHVHLGRGVGDRTYAVTDVRDLQSPYRLGIGDLTLDLRGLQLPPGKTRVAASVDVGRLTVVVPQDAALRVHGEADYGEVSVFGKSSDGHDARRTLDEPGRRALDLDAHVGAGSLHVVHAIR
jgi:phage shock protein PspC (stress-responsive transcriptional regulator)